MFSQSRTCQHVVCSEWRDALFDLLTERPRDALYSIAFALSCYPTYDDESSFLASRELFDLLDDSIRNTDQLITSELVANRPIDRTDYLRANDDYIAKLNTLRRFEKYWSNDENDVLRSETLNATDTKIINDIFIDINSTTPLPLLMNMSGTECSKTITLLNDDSIHTAIHEKDTAFTYTRNFTSFQTFLRYAPVFYRYDALRDIREKIERARNIHIVPIYLPVASVWQGGTSQLLWILLHSLAALSIYRGNIYLSRLLVILKNLSFFIWCVECRGHWETNGGDSFFDYVFKLSPIVKRRLPIDLVVAKIHNTIAANGHLNRAFTSWTLAQIVIDYREFVEFLLYRTTKKANRFTEFLLVECDDRFSALKPLYANNDVTTTTNDRRLMIGEAILRQLWSEIDPNIPIGTF